MTCWMTLSYKHVVLAWWRHKTEGLRKVMETLDLYKLAAISFDRFDLKRPQ